MATHVQGSLVINVTGHQMPLGEVAHCTDIRTIDGPLRNTLFSIAPFNIEYCINACVTESSFAPLDAQRVRVSTQSGPHIIFKRQDNSCIQTCKCVVCAAQPCFGGPPSYSFYKSS